LKRLITLTIVLAIFVAMPLSVKAQQFAVHFNASAPEGGLDDISGGIGLYVDNRVIGNQYLRTQLSSYNVVGEAAYTSMSPAAVLKYALGGGWGMSMSGGPDITINGSGEINVRTGLEITKNMFKTDFVKARVGFEQVFRDDRDGADLLNVYLGMSVTPPQK
jgi:hypothetical protein